MHQTQLNNRSVPPDRHANAGLVLVVDDTSIMRMVCKRTLEGAGYDVIIASDGKEAIKLARTREIDVALLDIRMPGLSGIDVLKTIKWSKPLVEVIMMTAYATQDIAEEATNLGASGFLTKPFTNPMLLTDTVNESVTRKRLKEQGYRGEINIAELLLGEKVITDEQLIEAEVTSKEWNLSITETLIKMEAIRPEDVDWALAKALDIPFVRLDARIIDREAIQRVPSHVARNYRLIPLLVENNNIHIVLDNPFNSGMGLEIIKRKTGLNPIVLKGHGPEIDAMLLHFYPESGSDLAGKIVAVVEKHDPELLSRAMECANILKLDKVEFYPITDGPDSRSGKIYDLPLQTGPAWVFRLEGIVTEKNNEGSPLSCISQEGQEQDEGRED